MANASRQWIARVQGFLEQASSGWFGKSARFSEEGTTTHIVFGGWHWLEQLLVATALLQFFLPFFVALATGFGRAVSIQTNRATWLVIGGLICLAVALALPERSLQISENEIRFTRGIRPFRRTKVLPLTTVRGVSVQAFTWASWDLFVAVQTDKRIVRLAWSVSEESAHQIADAIKRRTVSDRH